MAMGYEHSVTEREKAIADRLGALLRVDDEDPVAEVFGLS
jgi:hypothetical protein